MKPVSWRAAAARALAPIAIMAAITAWNVDAAPALTSTGVAQSGLVTSALVIETATAKHRYNVEVAATPQQQETGMMYRKSMPAGHGMIFPFAQSRILTFWMENTWLPLDLVFIASDGKVVSIAADAKAMSRDIISSGVPASAVLELNAGEAKRIGLKPGDRVRYKIPS